MSIRPLFLSFTALLILPDFACSSPTTDSTLDGTTSLSKESDTSSNDKSSADQTSADSTSDDESEETSEDDSKPSSDEPSADESSSDEATGNTTTSDSSAEESGDSSTDEEDESEENSSEEATSASDESSDTSDESTDSDDSNESGSESTETEESGSDESGSDDDQIKCAEAGKTPVVKMETNFGNMLIKLDGERAPNTTANFIGYVDEAFYDNTIFHRVIDDFMIQGGGYESGGMLKETKDPIDLEIHNELRHINGAISMARTMDPNSAASQFFICDGAQSGLDDEYAVFGVVIEGMDVLQAIASTPTGAMDAPDDEVIVSKAYCVK